MKKSTKKSSIFFIYFYFKVINFVSIVVGYFN